MTMTKGVNHVALTVLDLEQTVAFFTDILGYQKVGEDKDYPAAFVSDGITMLALWRVKEPEHAVSFDRRRHIGLHHLALTVDAADLQTISDRLKQVDGADVEFEPEAMYGGPSQHMMCTIPGSGIRLELTAPVN